MLQFVEVGHFLRIGDCVLPNTIGIGDFDGTTSQGLRPLVDGRSNPTSPDILQGEAEHFAAELASSGDCIQFSMCIHPLATASQDLLASVDASDKLGTRLTQL